MRPRQVYAPPFDVPRPLDELLHLLLAIDRVRWWIHDEGEELGGGTRLSLLEDAPNALTQTPFTKFAFTGGKFRNRFIH